MGSSFMRNPTVFLDVDGVLSDLWESLYKAHGIPYDPKDPKLPVGREAYFLDKVFGVTWEDLWKPYGDYSIVTMEKLPEADEIVRIVNTPERTWELAFLTCPLFNKLNGKYAWLKKHYPNIPIIITEEKTFCCSGPESLLIDDYDKNVECWDKCGGSTILFPRRWNSRHKMEPGYFPSKFIEAFNTWKDFSRIKHRM